MSDITVRNWTSDELQKVLEGDTWLITLLANAKTLDIRSNRAMSKIQEKIHSYSVEFSEDEVTTIYAADDETLLRFLDAQYDFRPLSVIEEIKTYRIVTFTKEQLESLPGNQKSSK